MAVMRAAAAAALWKDPIRCLRLYQVSLHPRPRFVLPVSSAEQTVLSKTDQTVRRRIIRIRCVACVTFSMFPV